MSKLKGWKNIIWHSLYGAPAAILLLLDQFKALDLTPLLAPFRSGPTVAAILTGMSVVGILLRLVTDGPVGGRRDDH